MDELSDVDKEKIFDFFRERAGEVSKRYINHDAELNNIDLFCFNLFGLYNSGLSLCEGDAEHPLMVVIRATNDTVFKLLGVMGIDKIIEQIKSLEDK